MFRFTIRELLLLVVIAALAVGWTVDHRVLAREGADLRRRVADLSKHFDDEQWKLSALVKLIEKREGQVEFGDGSVSLYIVAKHWSAGPGWTSIERK